MPTTKTYGQREIRPGTVLYWLLPFEDMAEDGMQANIVHINPLLPHLGKSIGIRSFYKTGMGIEDRMLFRLFTMTFL